MPPKFVRNPDYVTSNDRERMALLDGNSDEDDIFLKGTRGRPDRYRSDAKISNLQNEVDDVVDIMKSNVSKVLDRGERLEDLQDKSDSLADSSDMFRSRAKGLQKKMWWQNCKARIILIVVILVIIGIIVAIIASEASK